MNSRLFHRRTPAFNFPVREQGQQEILGRLGDLSEGGCLIYGPRPLEEGRLYRVVISAHDAEGRPKDYHFKAKAMWSAPDHNPAFYSTGLRFFDLMEPLTRAALNELLQLHTVALHDDED